MFHKDRADELAHFLFFCLFLGSCLGCYCGSSGRWNVIADVRVLMIDSSIVSFYIYIFFATKYRGFIVFSIGNVKKNYQVCSRNRIKMAGCRYGCTILTSSGRKSMSPTRVPGSDILFSAADGLLLASCKCGSWRHRSSSTRRRCDFRGFSI